MPRRKPPTPDRSKEALDAVREAKRPDPSASLNEESTRAIGSSSTPGNAPAVTAIHRPPSERHGPPAPPKPLHGLARLRAALKLSENVPLDDVHQEAALIVEEWSEARAQTRWPDDRTHVSVRGIRRL